MRALRTMNIAKRALLQKNLIQTMHKHTPYLYATRHIDIKVVSAQDHEENSAKLSAARPTSPAFKIYKFPLAGIASGTQRATGFALILGWTTAGLLSLPGLPITVLPVFIEGIKSVPILHGLVKFGVAFSFGYHGTKNAFMTRLPTLDVNNVHRAAGLAIMAGLTLSGIAVFLI
eukprot:UN01495